MEREAKKLILEIAGKAVDVAIARKTSRQQETKKLEQEQQLRACAKKRKKPWTWLTREARKVILEVVAKIEKEGRIKIGERKKRDLILKLRYVEKQQIEGSHDIKLLELSGIDQGFHQILGLELVRGNSSGSGKRKRGARAGRWASWSVDESRQGRRIWKRGLRRLLEDEPMSIVATELTELDLETNMSTMVMEEEYFIHLETGMSSKDDMSIGQGMDELTRQFMQLRVSRKEWSGMEDWESQGMEWLNSVAMSWGGELLRDFVLIDGVKRGRSKFEHFGEEVHAHQFLEEKLVELNQTSDYILDNFNTNLRANNNVVCVQDRMQEWQELQEIQELQGVQDELGLEYKEGTDKYSLEKGKKNIKNIVTMDSQGVLAVPLCDMNTMAVQQVQEDQEEVVKKDEMLMNREDKVTIKRRKRKGQRKDEGVQVMKLDKWLQMKEIPNSQGDRKRKYLDGGEVSNPKKRMFGNN